MNISLDKGVYFNVKKRWLAFKIENLTCQRKSENLNIHYKNVYKERMLKGNDQDKIQTKDPSRFSNLCCKGAGDRNL